MRPAHTHMHLILSVCIDVRPARLVERHVAPSAPMQFPLPRKRGRGEVEKQREREVKKRERESFCMSRLTESRSACREKERKSHIYLYIYIYKAKHRTRLYKKSLERREAGGQRSLRHAAGKESRKRF